MDRWVAGFVVVVPVLIPSPEESDLYQVNHATWRPGDLYELGEIDEPTRTAFTEGEVVRTEERSVPEHGDAALVVTELADDRPQAERSD
ncbi:MAG: hypothetical protein AAF517_07005 [Planctomycetota bacterium]